MKVGTQLLQLQLESRFCLRCLHFYLFPVCTAIRCLRLIPGFPLQLFTSILLYPVSWLIVHCCFLFIVDLPSFYLQFDDGNIVGAADICSYALDLDRWSDLPADGGVARVILLTFHLMSSVFSECILMKESSVCKNYVEHWAQIKTSDLLHFFSRYPTLICIFHFLVVTSLISASSVERNNLYFDTLTITFWRQLYQPFVMVPLLQRSSAWLITLWVWWKRCVGW